MRKYYNETNEEYERGYRAGMRDALLEGVNLKKNYLSKKYKFESPKFYDLYDELVPDSGKADSVAGEIVRAVAKIEYRHYNDGDVIGLGYEDGDYTRDNIECDPPARYLENNLAFEPIIERMWKVSEDMRYANNTEYKKALTRYRNLLRELVKFTVEYITKHPELKDEKNREDMWDYDYSKRKRRAWYD